MEVQYGLFSLIFLDVLFYLGKHVPPVLAYSLPVTGKMFSVASDYQVLCVFIGNYKECLTRAITVKASPV